MLAPQNLDGTMEAAKAVLADETEAESTLQTALVQHTGSGIPTVVAFVAGGKPVAAGHVVRTGRCGRVLGCMVSAVAPEVVRESDTVPGAVAQ
jgi:hypothetical protein